MSTEKIDDRYNALDTWPSEKIAAALTHSQVHGAQSLESMQTIIAEAADAAAQRLSANNKGRIVYVGAGSSIRIGVQDGVELLPTYDWPSSRLSYLIAGGEKALIEAVEGAEDDIDEGTRQTEQLALNHNDVFIAIAASGKTPYTIAAAKAAKQAGALVITCTNNPDSALAAIADYAIELETGSEVIAGSTRMAAATGQKVAMNMLSTLIMVRLNRVYDNLMVNLASSNIKLDKRRREILQAIIDVDNETAQILLEKANHNIKIAALLNSTNSTSHAEEILSTYQGSLRNALAHINKN